MKLFTKRKNKWFKNKETDSIWWLENKDDVGEHVFSFDKKTKYNLFRDYPYNLTPEQRKIFDEENPYWKNFFKDRNETIAKEYQKRAELLQKLRTEELYTTAESNSLIFGHYSYNPVVWEVFESVGINNPKYKTYNDHLAKKSIDELSTDEIVEQFLFWSRGERFCEGAIAEAIDSGNFVKLYEKFLTNSMEK